MPALVREHCLAAGAPEQRWPGASGGERRMGIIARIKAVQARPKVDLFVSPELDHQMPCAYEPEPRSFGLDISPRSLLVLSGPESKVIRISLHELPTRTWLLE
ncbi:hypothetical protein SUGI_1225530 [Cryptomeria japonica]|uniref:Uncharacterized protein n=1 Tax=Cryptomeria japonica TaxID=3369 RepID=A0AAD3NPR1_CRYJA|nr:hypothetical protein SUGI_1225530 [Cryptomeria japonica]